VIGEEGLSPLCIFVKDGSRQLLPLSNATMVPTRLVDDDWTDLALLEIDMQAALRNYARHSRLIDLDRFFIDWKPYASVSPLAAVGFPRERSYIDYDRRLVHTERLCFPGEYDGPANISHTHIARIIQPEVRMKSWAGVSGGPVFLWARRPGALPCLALCGIAIQGTTSSGIIRFVDAEILRLALDAW
jgi:hypothetical protein